MLPSLYIKLIGAAIVLAAIAWHVFGDLRLKSSLEQAQVDMASLRADKLNLETQLLKATQSAAQLDDAVKVAEAARSKVQADLQVTLKKLRNQKPPTECKAAVDWAIENKGDLKW